MIPEPASQRTHAVPQGTSRSGLRKDQLLIALVTLTVLGSVLVVGAVHPETLIALAPLAIGAVAVALSRNSIATWPAPTLIAFGLAGYTLLQAMPLPQSLVHRLSPASGAIWQSALQSIHQGDRWASLSLDPGASVVEALKWFCYAGVFAAAAKIGRSRGSSFGAELIFISAVVVGLIALAHWTVGARTLFGVYTPRFAAPRPAPLLNHNNFAGYMNLGGFCGLGLLGARDPRLPRAAIALLSALVFACGAMAGSRAGWAAWLIGFALLPWMVHRSSFGSTTVLRRLLLVQAAAACAGVLLFLFASDSSWRALFGEGWDKIWLFRWTLPMIGDHFWFGVGRGSFETAFPAYQGDSVRQLYQMAENFILQWCSEWGVPVTLAALLAFGWNLRPNQLGAKESPVAAGCVVAVAVLLLHNFFDLGLEVPGVMFALVALCGGMYGSRARRMRVLEQAAVQKLRWLAPIALVACGVGVTLAAWTYGRSTPIRDRDRVAEALRHGSQMAEPNFAGAIRAIESAISRHPSEPHFFMSRAWVASLTQENPLPWIARAIERNPMSGAPYFLLARTLLDRGARDQAFHSMSMAVARDVYFVPASARLALRASDDYGELTRAAPAGEPGAALLAELASQLKGRDKALRSRLLDEAIKRNPTSAGIVLARAEELMSALEEGNEPCENKAQRCVEQVEKLAMLAEQKGIGEDRPLVLRARLLLLADRAAEAERSLTGGCPSFASGASCSRWRLIAAEKVDDPSALRSAIDGYLASVCVDEPSCDAAASWLGARLEARRDFASALRVYEYVASRGGSSVTWRRVAVLASRMGLIGHARRAANQFVAGGGKMDPELATATQGPTSPQ